MRGNHNLFNSIFRSLASKGRGQAVCDCDLYDAWQPTRYVLTGELVVHDGAIYMTLPTEGCEADDIPGQSVHWEYLCDCPTTPTPVEAIPTPTPAGLVCAGEVVECSDGTFVGPDPTNNCEYPECPTPTPTPTPTPFVCDTDRYDTWTLKKYEANAYVSWKGCVWRALETEGTDADDEPSVSIHWELFCSCHPPVASPTPTPKGGGVCPQDVYTCSDGSTVNRDPSDDCNFFPCPTQTPTPAVEASPTPEVVYGTPIIEVSPTPQPAEASPTPEAVYGTPIIEVSPTPGSGEQCCGQDFEHTIVTTGSMIIEQDNPDGLDTNGFEEGGTLCFHSVNVTGGQSDFMVSTDQDGIMGVVSLIGTLADPAVVYISHPAGDCYVGNLTEQGGLNTLTKV